MLSVEDLTVAYGASPAVDGLSFEAAEGRVTAILGRNGAGKTTTLRAVMGFQRPVRGSVRWRGRDVTRTPPHAKARAGVGYLPETRGVLPSLTVEEQLRLAASRVRRSEGARWPLARLYEVFPRLAERRGNGGAQLSGGEQQMLGVARALALEPELLILDEPTEGLAPAIVRELLTQLAAIAAEGQTILLVEQNFRFAARLSDQALVLSKGRAAWSGPMSELSSDAALQRRWLGVG